MGLACFCRTLFYGYGSPAVYDVRLAVNESYFRIIKNNKNVNIHS